MSRPNFPPGMSAGQTPGFGAVDKAMGLVCDAPALYVEAGAVMLAIKAMMEHLPVFGADNPDQTRAIRTAMRDAASRALDGHWRRADDIESTEECGFDGDAEGTVEAHVMKADCPRCGWSHEIQQD